MTKYHWYLIGILAITFFSGCQNTYPQKELVQIKDIDYSSETQTTLVTVEHQGGCKNQNYQYEYQELDSNATDKTLTYGLFVDIQSSCKKKDLQFIHIPVPQSSFAPKQLIFQSSDNKKIIFISSQSKIKAISQIKSKSSPKISIIEDASFNQVDQTITFNAFIPYGCGENYTHKYNIIKQNSAARSAFVALITEVSDTCDLGDYKNVKMPLPKLSFQPDKLIFPVSQTKQIMLNVTSSPTQKNF